MATYISLKKGQRGEMVSASDLIGRCLASLSPTKGPFVSLSNKLYPVLVGSRNAFERIFTPQGPYNILAFTLKRLSH